MSANRNAQSRGGRQLERTTYDGLELPARDVEYSADGSLFAAFPYWWSQSAGRVALWRGGAGDQPDLMLLDLGVINLDPGLPFGPAWPYSAVKSSRDSLRIYVSGFGPTVVLDTASGQELDRIPGNGILAVRPDGRIAVR